MSLSWGEPLLAAGGSVLIGLVAGALLLRFVTTTLARLAPPRKGWVKDRLTTPFLLAAPLVFLKLVDPYADWAHPLARMAAQSQHVALVLAVAWLLVRALSVVEVLLLDRLERSRPVGPSLRKLRTQLSLLRRVLSSIVGLFTVALVLMTFAEIRQVGMSLLASAGAVAILFGIAAHRSMSNLVAGIQILFTEILRMDDAIVVEGEWGTVEDLTLTYVVVRLWDLRRLILPMTYFIEKPFQSWTYTSTNLLGTVTLWVDFDADIEALRRVFLESVHVSPRWDRTSASLQVIDASDSAVQIRCLVSATDAANLWDLRCEVREALLASMRWRDPSAWPKQRYRRVDQPLGLCQSRVVTSPEPRVQRP